jgi:Transposase DNA-binding
MKRKRQEAADWQCGDWIEGELAKCEFQDERHARRLGKLLEQFSDHIGVSIPCASQDWAHTKAAYRFFSNPRVSEEQILGGHFQATGERIRARDSLILMLHDTTEFTFHRHDAGPVGILTKSYMRKNKKGRPLHYTVCGILMHSSLAVATEGLPLGLAAIKFWTCDEFKGCNALKKKINPTRVPIERKESYRWLENMRQATALFGHPERCVHIGDRESDIYELFCLAQEAGTHFSGAHLRGSPGGGRKRNDR